MGYIDELIERCKEAKKAKKQFSETEFKKDQDLSDLKGIKNAVYKIEAVDGNSEKIFDNFKEHKEKTGIKLPKDNEHNKKSLVLYVGSSTTNLKSRISQHIGTGKSKNGKIKSTYALYLDDWFKGKYKITVREYSRDLPPLILQIIEDDLSQESKPLFGKTGGNGR